MDALGLSFVVIGILGAVMAVVVQRLISKTPPRTGGSFIGGLIGGLRIMLPMFIMSLAIFVAGLVLIVT